MSTRSNLLKNRGLVTSGSELTLPEGSLKQATNINVDENGVATPRRGFTDYGNTTDAISANRIKQLIDYKDRIFRHFSDQLEFEDDTGQFNSITGSFTEARAGYRTKWQESKGNMYFTTEEGIKRISLKDNSSLTSGGSVLIEQAGVPKAAYMEGDPLDTVGGFLPAQSKVAYRFIFGRKDANNNLLLGSASARHVISNSNDRVVTNQSSDLTIDHTTNAIADADYIVVSSLNTKYTFYFKTTGAAVSVPYKSDTFGTTFVEVDISNAVASNSDIAAVLANEISSNMSTYNVSLAGSVLTLESNEEGALDSIIISITNAGSIVESSVVAGTVVEGTPATCDLDLIIPSEITTDYFVQVYRTNIITASSGLTLDDIDPGDEMNLVYETAVTQAQITANLLEFNDNTPESFRASAAPLYSNEITGEGILQSNDPPPIALDMQLFRNSMFYANTKSTHKLEVSILSVDDFVAASTRIIVGNSTTSRYYTADAAEQADTPEGGDFLLSVLVSVGQAIDETARSLVKIINQDSNSIVNAFYLTGADDLPGQILLEARDLTDDAFYIAVEESSVPLIGQEFSPELPVSKPAIRLSGGTSTANFEVTGHGFTTGDTAFISFFSDGDVDAPTSISGVFEVTVTDVDNFTIVYPLAASYDSTGANPFSTSDSAAFKNDTESDNLEFQNRLYYSKADEPEAVPLANYIDVGAKDEEIKRILALRDNLFVLKGDGIFIVSGTSAPDFSVRLLDNTSILAPDSAVVLNNQIFCVTEQGVTKVTDSGAGVISRGIENLIDEVVNSSFDYAPNTFGVSYENDRAYVLFMPNKSDDTSATQAYRYNIFEKTWTRWEYNATCGHVMSNDSKLYLGNGDRNFIAQERKSYDRTDHSDRDFTIQISSDGVDGDQLKISNTDDIEVSDVVVQIQEVSINYINSRILRRMDTFDTGIIPPSGSSMVDSFSVSAGDSMVTKFQALNDYLVTIDPWDGTGGFTAKAVTSSTLLADVQLMVTELNITETISTLKNYKNPETVQYEAYITSVDAPSNFIYIHQARPFLQDDIQVYKNIKKVIEWNPQHFGDPSALKQIREVTILFDQNNFYDATARFGSDVAQALTDVKFQGKGIGYWGDMDWGNANHYWGGEGNDIPFRTNVPRDKQKCRYLTLVFEHSNARESFRILGVTGVVRPISSRAWK